MPKIIDTVVMDVWLGEARKRLRATQDDLAGLPKNAEAHDSYGKPITVGGLQEYCRVVEILLDHVDELERDNRRLRGNKP